MVSWTLTYVYVKPTWNQNLQEGEQRGSDLALTTLDLRNPLVTKDIHCKVSPFKLSRAFKT